MPNWFGTPGLLPSLTLQTQGPFDIRVVRRDQTVALVKALQQCTKWLGPPGILCGAVQYLQRCLEPLLERDYLLEAPMLDVMGNEPMDSEDLWLRISEPSMVPLPIQTRKADKLDEAARPELVAVSPQDVQ